MMIIPEIKNVIFFEDIDYKEVGPGQPFFKAHLQLLIGPSNSIGEESFELMIRPPAALRVRGELQEDQADPKPGFLKQGLFVIEKFDLEEVVSLIENHILQECTGENWNEVSEKLSKLMWWEFEDYTPYRGDKMP